MTDIETSAQEQKSTNNDQFDMNRTPASLEIARRHQKSRAIGRVIDLQSIDPATGICPCCGNIIEKESLGLMISLKDLGFLGSGVSLYFYFVKFCIFFLCIIAVVSSIYNALSNDFRGTIDFHYNIDTIAALNFFCAIILMGASIILRKHMKKLNQLIDIDNVTPSDFTVIITNLLNGTTEKEIEIYLRQHTKHLGNIHIVKIVLAYDIARFITLKQEYQETLNQSVVEKAKMKRTGDTNGARLRFLTDKMQGLENRIREQESGIQEDQFLSCGTAFVTFGTDQMAEEVVKAFKQGRFMKIVGFITGYRNLKGRSVYIERAPEPTDIYWENLSYTFFSRFKHKCITYFMTAVLLTACFFIIFALSRAQNTILAFLASVCILIINNGLSMIIRKLALFEKHATITYYYIGVAEKSGLAQFLNTTIIVYIIKKIKWGSAIYVPGGLVSSIEFIAIMNFVQAFSPYWNPFYLKKLWDRHRMNTNQQLLDQTPQYKAHTIFEGNTFDFPQQFAKSIKILMFASFYSYVSPIIIWGSIVTIAVIYLADKFYLLRICRTPDMLSQQLPMAMADFYIELMIVIFCVGNLVFEDLLFELQSGWSVAALVLSIIFLLFDFQTLFESCTQRFERITISCKRYEDYSYQFLTDYERSNPVTATKAIEEWQKQLKDSKIGGVNNNSQFQRQATKSLLSNYAMSRPSMQFNGGGGFLGSNMFGSPFMNQSQFQPMMHMQNYRAAMNVRQIVPMGFQQQQQMPSAIPPQQELQQLQVELPQLQFQLEQVRNPIQGFQIVNTIEQKKRRIAFLMTLVAPPLQPVPLANPLMNAQPQQQLVQFSQPQNTALQNPLVVQSNQPTYSAQPQVQMVNPMVNQQQPPMMGYAQPGFQQPQQQQPQFYGGQQQPQFQQQQYIQPAQQFNGVQQGQYQPLMQQNQNYSMQYPVQQQRMY